jgi:hypothetical protein
MRKHPLDHHPSFRAVIAAAPHLFELALASREDDLVMQLAIAAGELVSGFRAPVGSPTRTGAHHRAWVVMRELERSVIALRVNHRAPRGVLDRAQRAIDRADVMIGALPGVISTS